MFVAWVGEYETGGILYIGHLGARRTVLIVKVSSFQGLKLYCGRSIVSHLVSAACVCIRGVSAIQGAGLEGCLQFRGLD